MKRQEESKTEASQAPSDPLITGPSKLLRSPLHVEITTAADKMVPSNLQEELSLLPIKIHEYRP